MINLTCDISRVKATLDQLTQNIAELAPSRATKSTILAEFVAWQEEDMKRQYPNVVIVDEMTAMTRIWPRSRTTSKRRQKEFSKRARGGRRIAAPKVVRKGKVVTQGRPILRPELFEQLCLRMREMLNKVVPWAGAGAAPPPGAMR